MGFIIDVDLETNQGPSHEVYVRIESIVINRVTAKVRLQLTYWIDEDHAIAANKVFADDEQRAYHGLVQERVLYFEDEESEGVEILLPHMVEEDLAREKTVETPVFEEKEVTKEVPYVSFDENGDEITLYRTVTSTERVKVGVTTETRNVIDPSLACDIYSFGYSKIKKMLEERFPADKIVIS